MATIFNSIFNSTDNLQLAELSIIGLTIYCHPNISNMTDDEYKVTTYGVLLKFREFKSLKGAVNPNIFI